MKLITAIFWNKIDHRLRAAWRILIQTILFYLGTVLVGVIAGLGMLLAVMAEKGISFQNMDSAAQHLSEIMASSPWFTLVSMGGSLLIMILTMLFASRLLDHRPLADFGFHFNKAWWADFGFGLALGAILMILIFLAELAFGWISITGYMQTYDPQANFGTAVLISLFVFICVGFYEEMLSRGYHLRNLAEGLNIKKWSSISALVIAWIISSSIFGMMHLGNPNASLISTINLVVAGMFLGLGYVLTGELALPIGLHITWNFFQGIVFGFPVSGTSNAASFIVINQGGSDIMTGGAFGPEAGIVGLVAMLLGSLFIWLWVRYRKGKAEFQTRLADYQPPAKPDDSFATVEVVSQTDVSPAESSH
jgi:membrane protease YdiL (CAAX protease family)